MDSLIGQQVKTVDGKTITIKNQKEVNGETIFVDKKGNIYTEEELELTFALSPEYLLFESLRDLGIVKDDWNGNVYHEAFERFMANMVKSGYVVDGKNK